MNRPACHKDSDITDWIKDVDIEMWGMELNIDFDEYSQEPYYKVNNLFSSIILDSSRIQTTYLFFSKTVFNHLDSWIPWAGRAVGEFYKISKKNYRPEDSRERPNELYNMIFL
jgi:hypothetical protein